MHILLVFCISRVLDMHLSLCYCSLLIAYSNDHLFCYMIICFAIWSLWSFPYDCHMFDKVAHMFHNMFTWLHFSCYIILVLLSLDLPWGSNVFCASVSDYRYICSKCYIGFRFRCEWVLSLFLNSCLSLESVIECFVTE